MKNVTFSADDRLIKRAREVARSQGKTLNEAIREWLVQFTQGASADQYDSLMKRLRRRVQLQPPYTREEMNRR